MARKKAKKASKTKASTPNGKLEIKELESWLWEAACGIRGALDAPKYKDYILPLIFLKRLSDVFDDEIDRMAEDFGDPETALEMAKEDRDLIRFWVPKVSRWTKIRKLTNKIGEKLTDAIRAIAKENPRLRGVIDNVDFNAAIAGERIIGEDKLSALIETINRIRLGLKDVQPDILGRAYEYLLRKFAEGQGQSAGEFFTPPEVAWVMAYSVAPKEGESVYDPCCGSGGLLVKCELLVDEKAGGSRKVKKPLKLYGQEENNTTFAMAKMNTIVHDMDAEIKIGDTLRAPKFLESTSLQRFDMLVANPMWNQDGYTEAFYDADPYERFKFGFPTAGSADWGWAQHMTASLTDKGRAAIVLDTGAVSRGSGQKGTNREKEIRKAFVEKDWIEAVLLLPDNLFYNTSAPGIVLFLKKAKSKKKRKNILLVNASQEFEKGRPKNFITPDGIQRISKTIGKWKEEEKFSQIVSIEEVQKNDYNLSPSRYIEVVEAETHRPNEHILYDLEQAEKEAKSVDKELTNILKKMGLKAEAYDA